jgi:hypothetical protein
MQDPDMPPRITREARSNRTFLWGFVVGALLMAALAGGFLAATDEPYGGTPECTDVIADAGGICHGEPR